MSPPIGTAHSCRGSQLAVSATEYRPGDYLTTHNDLLQTTDGGGRRLAFVLQVSCHVFK